MSQQLHAQANALLYRALEQAPAERHRFIEQASAGCRELFQLVSSMLSHIDQLDAFLHEPLAASLDEAPAHQQPQAGDLIGRWRVVREVQHGRLGEILLVEHVDEAEHDTRRIAALKIVDAAALSLEQLALFHRQRQLLAALTHPDIARLVDSGVLPDGDPYVVLEYSDGQPIDAFCSDTGAGRDTRIALMARVCQAVHHGHQHLVLHRHLEPASILVERDGTLKVTDFGVSALFDPAPPSATTGDDLRALGAVLRKLLLDEGGRLPRALERILDKAAGADPHTQYGSADELAHALLAHLEPAPAPEPQLGDGHAGAGRGVLARSLGGVLLAALGAGAALAWQHLQQQERTAPRPQASAPAKLSQPPAGSDALRTEAARLMEQGDTAKAVAQLRLALAAREQAGAATPEARLAVAQERIALAHGLVASGAYAAADNEFKLARAAWAALPSTPEQRIAIAEIDLARANGQYLRKHWRTAGQTVRAMRAALPAKAGDLLRARAALLEALIQPGGTAAQAYAAARKALPVVAAGLEADPNNASQWRESALAWRRTGEIAARAGQLDAACDYYAQAEQRYAHLDKRGRLGAPGRNERTQLASLRSACK